MIRYGRGDIHTTNAQDIFGRQDVTHEERNFAKSLLLGANLGLGPRELARRLNEEFNSAGPFDGMRSIGIDPNTGFLPGRIGELQRERVRNEIDKQTQERINAMTKPTELLEQAKAMYNSLANMSPTPDVISCLSKMHNLIRELKTLLPTPDFTALNGWMSEYEVDPETYKILTPGKFEGNPVWVEYVWDAVMNGEGTGYPTRWFVDGDQRGTQYTYELDPLECATFNIDDNGEGKLVLVWETEQGFVHGIELEDQARANFEAEQAEIGAEMRREDEERQRAYEADLAKPEVLPNVTLEDLPTDPREGATWYREQLDAMYYAYAERRSDVADAIRDILDGKPFDPSLPESRYITCKVPSGVDMVQYDTLTTIMSFRRKEDGEWFDPRPISYSEHPEEGIVRETQSEDKEFAFSEIPIVGIQLRIQPSSGSVEYRGRDTEPWQSASNLQWSSDPHHFDGKYHAVTLTRKSTIKDGGSIVFLGDDGQFYWLDKSLRTDTYGVLYCGRGQGELRRERKAKGRFIWHRDGHYTKPENTTFFDQSGEGQ